MNIATLIFYSSNKKVDRKERERFRRCFLGYKDKSNYGRYKYVREGLLKTIPHLKPGKSLVIVRNKDQRKVLNMLTKFNMDYFTKKILLSKQEFEILNKNY